MKFTIDVEPDEIGIVRVALDRALEGAVRNRDVLKDSDAVVLAQIDRRIAVLTTAKDQISEQEVADWMARRFGTAS